MEKGILEFGKFLLEPVPEERKGFITSLEDKLDTQLDYALLSMEEKVKVLEALVKELQEIQVVKDFAELSGELRHQERIRSIKARTKDPGIVTHHLHKVKTETFAFKNLKLHRFKFDIEQLYVYNGKDIFVVPCALAKRVIGSHTEEVDSYLDKVEVEAREPFNFKAINEAEQFDQYSQKNHKTYAELFARSKGVSMNTAKEPTFSKIKADFGAIISVLSTNTEFSSSIKCDLYCFHQLHRVELSRAVEEAKTASDLMSPYITLVTKASRQLLANLLCTQGAAKRSKTREAPKQTASRLAFYLYAFDLAFRYDVALAAENAEEAQTFISKMHEGFAMIPYFRKVDNAGIKEKQESFKTTSLLKSYKEPLNVRYEQMGKDMTRLGMKYSDEAGNKEMCYSCRLKGSLVQCANCPARFHPECEKWKHVKYEKGKEGELCEKCYEIYDSDVIDTLDKKLKFKIPRFPKYHSLSKDCYQVNLLNNRIFEAALAKYKP
eukprot:TRINITY_DN2696_c0_g2_i1.p1 TRINITY_DN2696_c0_g2~~TRINITY_DN2696_c0_g2_i1.p1  ORF type:complete len:493 (+),score=91.63 TRINITY_DN2696_c0_g2_i1:786-2264(+)